MDNIRTKSVVVYKFRFYLYFYLNLYSYLRRHCICIWYVHFYVMMLCSESIRNIFSILKYNILIALW